MIRKRRSKPTMLYFYVQALIPNRRWLSKRSPCSSLGMSPLQIAEGLSALNRNLGRSQLSRWEGSNMRTKKTSKMKRRI
jgi:hypothetical protein